MSVGHGARAQRVRRQFGESGAAMVLGYFLVMAFVYSAPVILVLWLVRRRVKRTAAGALIAAAFTAATMYSLWRFDGFDVWRHGWPSASYMLQTYVPWLAPYGLVGWFTGARIVGRRPRACHLATS